LNLPFAKDFSCPICFDIFKNPVLLSCSHSFCKDCVQSWWADKPIPQCPVCTRRSSKTDPPCNLVLKNLCEAFLQELSLEDTAALFCLDHEQPVCIICRDSKTHTNHRFRPINEAAQDYKEELRKVLKPLQEKVERLSQLKVDWDQTTEHINDQARHTEKRIKDEFKKLQDFLQKEEEARLTVLREEEEQKKKLTFVLRDALPVLLQNDSF
uniref:RING-type domain-containing protein n=1 Tax=Lates calcarifer TaxID=8187 RepID=A0A4W6FAB3_LATCA